MICMKTIATPLLEQVAIFFIQVNFTPALIEAANCLGNTKAV